MKIHKIRGKSAVAGDVGIELEVEGKRLPFAHVAGREPMHIDGMWSIVHDGSLRNGAEYVLTKPIKANKVRDALDEMAAMFEAQRTEPSYSFRTSTHVHINANDLEYEQVLNFIYTYALLENLIAKTCGKSRLGNRFCLRIADAEGTLKNINRLIQMRKRGGYGFAAHLDEASTKYAAINIYVLRKYGSIEFRMLEGTDDWKKIENWVNTLLAIREFSTKMKDIPSIWEHLNKVGAKDFAYEVLGNLADLYWSANAESEITVQASITYDLVLECLRNPAGPFPEVKPNIWERIEVPDVQQGPRAAVPHRGGFIWDRFQDIPPGLRAYVFPENFGPDSAWVIDEHNLRRYHNANI